MLLLCDLEVAISRLSLDKKLFSDSEKSSQSFIPEKLVIRLYVRWLSSIYLYTLILCYRKKSYISHYTRANPYYCLFHYFLICCNTYFTSSHILVCKCTSTEQIFGNLVRKINQNQNAVLNLLRKRRMLIGYDIIQITQVKSYNGTPLLPN